MTTPPFVEGNASEYNLVEDYASEADYGSEDYSNWTEAAPDSNLVESLYYAVLPDVLIDEYVPAHAAPTTEAEITIEQSVAVEAVEADATLESEIAVESVYDGVFPDVLIDEYVPAHVAPTIEAENAIEQSVAVEAVEADATLESETAIEEEEDTMSEWSEEEDEDVTSESSEETWVESEDEDMISEGSEEASEDEAWVAGEVGLTIQDSAEANTPLDEETWVAGEGVMVDDSAELNTPSELGTLVAIDESFRRKTVEAITYIHDHHSCGNIDVSDPNVVVDDRDCHQGDRRIDIPDSRLGGLVCDGHDAGMPLL